MTGKFKCEKTAIVLGAGASYCYETNTKLKGIPTQENILNRMSNVVKITTSSGKGAPNFSSNSGMFHSFALSQYICNLFKVKEPDIGANALGFWDILQQNGYNLESFYNYVEEQNQIALLQDLQAIIRANVLEPTEDRSVNEVCKFHRKIAENIGPSDYIINFNWDTLISDALLYCCPMWYPATGFGIDMYPLLHLKEKNYRIPSQVKLYQLHGSTVLYKQEDKDTYLYVGPKTYDMFTGLKIIKEDCKRKPTDIELRKLELGWVYIENRWFHPVFIAPSKKKLEYKSLYFKLIRSMIHAELPFTKQFIIIGYSFPEADIEYLNQIFVPEVIDRESHVIIVNPMNDDQSFRDKVSSIFPDMVNGIDFSNKDFKLFVQKFDNA